MASSELTKIMSEISAQVTSDGRLIMTLCSNTGLDEQDIYALTEIHRLNLQYDILTDRSNLNGIEIPNPEGTLDAIAKNPGLNPHMVHIDPDPVSQKQKNALVRLASDLGYRNRIMELYKKEIIPFLASNGEWVMP